MTVQRRGDGGAGGDSSMEEAPLQAVLLADSFTQRFRPITMEKPKVLLPLVGVPMIDYTLEWLASAGVEQVYVFCCAHAKQVTSYLRHSRWSTMPNLKLTCIQSHDSVSVGDALRSIDEKNVIHGDFVLVSGDTVSNMSLSDVVREHKARRKKDKLAVMTMVIKRAKPCSKTRLTRLGNEELVLAVDPDTKELLHYDNAARHSATLDKSSLADRHRVQLHVDMQDCHIDICSPEVLMLFTDNFDYQQMRRDFVRGLLSDEIMGNKLYTYEICEEYAARVDNLRAYDTVSKDVLHRWTYPLVPDIPFSRAQAPVTLDCFSKYRETVNVARTVVVGENTFIGEGTVIGERSLVEHSVIGRNCVIGSDVVIKGSYIWDNVRIDDGAQVHQSVLCDEVVVKPRARLEPGTVLSFKVVIGEGFVVPSYSRISRVFQPLEQDSSDEELEYADADNQKKGNGVLSTSSWISAEVGDGGAGFQWVSDDKDDWKHSVAAIPMDMVKDRLIVLDEEPDDALQVAPRDQHESSDEDDQESNDFEKEVEEMFKRAVCGVQLENVVLEVNALKLAYNKEFADCAGAMFKAVLNLALRPAQSSGQLLQVLTDELKRWKTLLRCFIKSVDDEIEILLTFEEFCTEGTHARLVSPLFCKILEQLYDNDLISEDAILSWASEKDGADESDKVFLMQSQPFIKWLTEAEEEEDE